MKTTTTSAAAVRTLEPHGPDCRCGGELQPADVMPADVIKETQQTPDSGATNRDWRTAPLGELVKHIVATHHAYLKMELPAIGNRMDRVLAVHGGRDPEMLPRMAAVYRALNEEMNMHMHKEEAILFPFIEQYGHSEATGLPLPRTPFGSIANPIAMMEREHEEATGALEEIRGLTRNYELPPYACRTVRALYDGIQALEADLLVHIDMENNILFPRAIALEKR